MRLRNRAAEISDLAGVDLPIEARRRYTYIFSVDEPLNTEPTTHDRLEKMLPVLKNRIHQFSTARVTDPWVGHYEFNTFDHNAIIGAHTEVTNLMFCAGIFRS